MHVSYRLATASQLTLCSKYPTVRLVGRRKVVSPYFAPCELPLLLDFLVRIPVSVHSAI
jgi:hypothetical protein